MGWWLALALFGYASLQSAGWLPLQLLSARLNLNSELAKSELLGSEPISSPCGFHQSASQSQRSWAVQFKCRNLCKTLALTQHLLSQSLDALQLSSRF